ncbi:regulator of G-protein signaling 14-like isoform X4 [Eleginops maclovinus]|uniref:regulator of G-protein signaling 14-like isoform X4 n=1 Tax=Eleginops maclovinus TaxID=56733 RepID=UPI0030808AAA
MQIGKQFASKIIFIKPTVEGEVALQLRGIYRRFSHLAKDAALKQFKKYEHFYTTGIMAEKKSQAVSDGELNMSTRGCGGSSSSLPGSPGGETGPANNVLSWAISFEKLLEDPYGVRQFTSFLMSEVSAENILFWQACEKFRKISASSVVELKAAARSIYNTYLSDNAPYSVNIDDTAKTEEKDLEEPSPDMFNKAQAQIFKLMKMDSYRRFVRSPLFQSCTLPGVEDTTNIQGSVSRKEAQLSVKSSSGVELGSLYWQIENGRSSPRSLEQGAVSRIGVEGGYCCVYLPDGSASLAPTRNGQPIKEMLASLCEKRGFPLKDVIIYLHGKDKQPLSLEQDCSVLRDQQVSLELRVMFKLEIVSTGKTVGIMVKSSKTLQDALSAVLQKHRLKPQEALVTMVGSEEPLNMTGTVFRLANKTLRLDKIKGNQTIVSRGSSSAAAATQAGGLETRSLLQTDRAKPQSKASKNREMDGFLDMLTRAQGCRVDDQRGLLTKEQLEVPLFLKPEPDTKTEQPSTTSSSTDDPNKTSTSAGAGKETPKSAESEDKDLKETAV